MSISKLGADCCDSNLHIIPVNPSLFSIWFPYLLPLNSLVLCFGVALYTLSIYILIFVDCTFYHTSLLCLIAICPASATLLFETLGNLPHHFSSGCQAISFWLLLLSYLSCRPNSNFSPFIGGGIEPSLALTSS